MAEISFLQVMWSELNKIDPRILLSSLENPYLDTALDYTRWKLKFENFQQGAACKKGRGQFLTGSGQVWLVNFFFLNQYTIKKISGSL